MRSYVVEKLLEHYFAEYEKEPNGKEPLMMTTDEIVNVLDDMADLQANEVADAMISLDFNAVWNDDGSHGWIIYPKE